MKKLLSLLLFSFCLILPVNAQCSCNNSQENTLSVSANASKEVAPDTVEINIEVQTNDSKSMQVAMNQNNEISQKVIDGLRQNINSENGDYLKTSDFRADTLYLYTNNKRTFDKYQVTNTVIVHTSSITKIPEIIEKAISYGATRVSNLNFSVSNYEQYKEELLKTAVKKAEQQATIAANSAGKSIKDIKSINIINNDSAYSRFRNTAVNFKAAGAITEDSAALAPSIEPGIIKIQASVNITYRIK